MVSNVTGIFFLPLSADFSPVLVIFLVVLQGPLHLEIQPAASGPRWELGLVVQARLLLQNMRRWSSLPQQTVQQPSVSAVAARRRILGGERTETKYGYFFSGQIVYMICVFIQQMITYCKSVNAELDRRAAF